MGSGSSFASWSRWKTQLFDFPTIAATVSAVASGSASSSRRQLVDSSRGVRLSRWTFSTIIARMTSMSVISRTMAGTSIRPAERAARQRRSPATISKRSPSSPAVAAVGLTSSGSRMPDCLIDSASSSRVSLRNIFRGFSFDAPTKQIGSCRSRGAAAPDRRRVVPAAAAGFCRRRAGGVASCMVAVGFLIAPPVGTPSPAPAPR